MSEGELERLSGRLGQLNVNRSDDALVALGADLRAALSPDQWAKCGDTYSDFERLVHERRADGSIRRYRVAWHVLAEIIEGVMREPIYG